MHANEMLNEMLMSALVATVTTISWLALERWRRARAAQRMFRQIQAHLTEMEAAAHMPDVHEERIH